MVIGIDGNEANISQRVGINQWAFELLKNLYKLDTKHKFIIFLKDRPLPDLPPPRENFVYEVFGPRKSWVLSGLTLRLWRGPKIDVLFTPSHYVPLLTSVRRVCSVVDLSYEKFDGEYFKQYDLQQLKRWTRLSVKLADKVITISSHSKNDIEEIYSAKPDKVEIVYPGYNEDLYQSRIPLSKYHQVKEKYGIKRKYFLFVGTLQPRKNIQRLIKAFSKLDTNCQLVIAGKKGWLYEEILAESKKLGIENKVIFAGFVPSEDLPSLMKHAIAYVLPSLYEGFGIPVIEAQATGGIVLVSRVTSLPEVVMDSGLYIEDPMSVSSITQGLQAALKLNKKQRLEMKIKAKLNAKRFSWENAAKRTLSILVGKEETLS